MVLDEGSHGPGMVIADSMDAVAVAMIFPKDHFHLGATVIALVWFSGRAIVASTARTDTFLMSQSIVYHKSR